MLNYMPFSRWVWFVLMRRSGRTKVNISDMKMLMLQQSSNISSLQP
jgi:hypothetical protein